MGQTARTIAIVGPDGCGKTTQAKLLVERFQTVGYDAYYVHALYYLSDSVPCADRLRAELGPRKTRTQRPAKSGASYLLRRVLFGLVGFCFALLTVGVVAVRFRQSDQIVVFDRYYQQFLYDVYGQFGVRLLGLLPQTHHTVYLNADISTIQTRMEAADRAVDDQYDTTVIDLYETCTTDEWLSVPAGLPIETLHDRIFEAVRPDRKADRTKALHRRSETKLL